MKISQNCIDMIRHFEGCKLVAYKCPADVWTIGYGHTQGVHEGMTITQAQADDMLRQEIARFEREVESLIKIPSPLQCQFDALVSFAYNVGSDIDSDNLAEGLGDSTLLKKFNAGDIAGAAAEFPKWNRAGGKVSNGLINRRNAERRMFLGLKWRDS